MSYKGSAVVAPRQLAPSVGKTRAGVVISPAPNLANYSSSTPVEPMFFGSLSFVPHLSAFSPAFDALHEGVNLTFGDFHFHATREGVLRFPDPPRHQATESTVSSIASSTPIVATPSPPQIASVGDTESNLAMTIFLDRDSCHPMAAEKSVDSDVDDRADSESCNSSRSPVHRMNIAQVYMADSNENITSAGRRTHVTITQETLDRIRAAIAGGTPMPEDAHREDLMAYHRILYEQQQGLAQLQVELDERRRRAEASSQRLAALS